MKSWKFLVFAVLALLFLDFLLNGMGVIRVRQRIELEKGHRYRVNTQVVVANCGKASQEVWHGRVSVVSGADLDSTRTIHEEKADSIAARVRFEWQQECGNFLLPF